jgi:hypothetical protein
MKQSKLKQLIKETILAEVEAVSHNQQIYGKTTSGEIINFKLDKYNELHCYNKNLKTLVVNDPKVEYILCDNNQLTILKLGKLPNLRYLYCINNKLKSLNVSGCLNLQDLNCMNNNLVNLDLSKCSKLETLSCKNNQLTTLDVSKCPNLIILSHDDEVKVIKNTLTETHNKTFTDDEMLKSVKNYHNMKYLSRHNVNLYKAVKEKEKTDPEFFKKLKSHMVSKTNYPPQEHNIAELVSVSGIKKPWSINYISGKGWWYGDNKNENACPIENDSKYFYFVIPLDFMWMHSDEYNDALAKLEPKDIPQFIKQDLRGLVKKATFDLIAQILTNIYKSKFTMYNFRIKNDYVAFKLDREELQKKGFINDK